MESIGKTPHVLCGAKTRSGIPCQNWAMSNGRCRMHGGKSTGPKTPEGKEHRTEDSSGTRTHQAGTLDTRKTVSSGDSGT